MKLVITVVLALSFLNGCTVTPSKRFPEFSQQLRPTPNVDLVINTFVRSDISGSGTGINIQKNNEALQLTRDAITEALHSRGITPNIVFADFGLTHKKTDNYFYSEDWKSTNEPYLGLVTTEQNQQWLSEDVQDFFIGIVEYGAVANTKKQYRRILKKSEKNPKKKIYVNVPIPMPEIPALVTELPSNILIYAQMDATEIGKGKSVGTAVATGLVTALLTGGMYVASSSSWSGSRINIIAIDTDKKSVIWQNSFQGQNYKKVKDTVNVTLSEFPNIGKAVTNDNSSGNLTEDNDI